MKGPKSLPHRSIQIVCGLEVAHGGPSYSVPRLSDSLRRAAMSRRPQDRSERVDLIQSHGLWRMPNIYAARVAKSRGVPHVVSPAACSAPWPSTSKLSKQVFWWTGQGDAIESAGCRHATSEAEYLEFREAGITRPVAVIPNGIDLPGLTHLARPHRHASGKRRTLLYVGRVHPKKGCMT